MYKLSITYSFLILLFVSSTTLVAQINRNYTYREPEPKQTNTTKKKSSKKPAPEKFQFKGLEYGFTLGGYLANNRTANYFNGQSGANSIESIIGKDAYAGTSNGSFSYTHQKIKDSIFNGEDFHLKELPMNMHYNPGPLLGFFAKLNVNDYTGFYVEFNYTKLNTIDKFTIEKENVSSGFISNKDNNNVFGRIQGTEKRNDINAGVYHSFSITKRCSPFIEGGINFNSMHVDAASITIDNLPASGTLNTYQQYKSLTFSFINPYNEIYKVRDYGNGYGAYVGGGIRLIFKQTLFINIGYNMAYKLINLGIYKGYYLTNTVYMRFNYWQKLWSAEEIQR